MTAKTVLLLGAGRMGGAMIDGWTAAGPVIACDLIIRDPHPGPEALAAAERGARLNPPDSALAEAAIAVLAVKPQLWRAVAAEVQPYLSPDACIISIAAGVKTSDLGIVFEDRPVARVMPTTAVAVARGAASIYAAGAWERGQAHRLFDTIATTVDLDDEDLMHAATAVSGSGPAYLYAFVEALEAAGIKAGLTTSDAAALARATVVGAAALMATSEASPAELRAQVTSPGGTTQAALEVLMGEGGLRPLLDEAVQAAIRRSKELG